MSIKQHLKDGCVGSVAYCLELICMMYNKWYYRHLTSSQKKHLEYFTKKMFDNLRLVTSALYKELGAGYDAMVKKDRDAYYNSDFYKQARKKQLEKTAQNIETKDIQQKLGYWVPAKRSTGDKHHITYSRTSDQDALNYVPIPLEKYVYDKASILARKYNDTTTLTGLALQMLTEEKYRYRISEEFEWFCYKHYEDKGFCFGNHILELTELFPVALKNVLSHIDRGPTVQENSIVIVRVKQNGKLSSFNINTEKFPIQKHIIGKVEGETFNLPNIDIDYIIERIY